LNETCPRRKDARKEANRGEVAQDAPAKRKGKSKKKETHRAGYSGEKERYRGNSKGLIKKAKNHQEEKRQKKIFEAARKKPKDPSLFWGGKEEGSLKRKGTKRG